MCHHNGIPERWQSSRRLSDWLFTGTGYYNVVPPSSLSTCLLIRFRSRCRRNGSSYLNTDQEGGDRLVLETALVVSDRLGWRLISCFCASRIFNPSVPPAPESQLLSSASVGGRLSAKGCGLWRRSYVLRVTRTRPCFPQRLGAWI